MITFMIILAMVFFSKQVIVYIVIICIVLSGLMFFNYRFNVVGHAFFGDPGSGDVGQGGDVMDDVSEWDPSAMELETIDIVRASTFFYGAGLVAKEEGDGLEYFHVDHLGSPSVITDESGGKKKSIRYLPYGATMSGSYDTVSFTGKELDSSGISYFGARYYDNSVGRFTQADPKLRAAESNYHYAAGNPMKFIDPTGMQQEDAGMEAWKKVKEAYDCTTLLRGAWPKHSGAPNYEADQVIQGMADSGDFLSLMLVVTGTTVPETDMPVFAFSDSESRAQFMSTMPAGIPILNYASDSNYRQHSFLKSEGTATIEAHIISYEGVELEEQGRLGVYRDPLLTAVPVTTEGKEMTESAHEWALGKTDRVDVGSTPGAYGKYVYDGGKKMPVPEYFQRMYEKNIAFREQNGWIQED